VPLRHPEEALAPGKHRLRRSKRVWSLGGGGGGGQAWGGGGKPLSLEKKSEEGTMREVKRNGKKAYAKTGHKKYGVTVGGSENWF